MGKIAEFESVQQSSDNFRSRSDLVESIDPKMFDIYRCPSMSEQVSKHAFPLVDTMGFQQNADGIEESYSPWGTGEFRERKVRRDTVEDRVQEHVFWSLNPKERDAYASEAKAISKYNQDFLDWASLNRLSSKDAPTPPDVPMHREVKKRIEDLKQRVTDDVRSQMSPEQLKDLDRAMKQYDREYRAALGKNSLLLVFHEPLPKPPAIVQDYYRRIREAVNKL